MMSPAWYMANNCSVTCLRSKALAAVQLASSDLAEVPCLRRIYIAATQKNVPSNKDCCADFMPATQCTNLVNLLGKFSIDEDQTHYEREVSLWQTWHFDP